MIWQKTGQSVTLPCKISSHCSANKWQYQWFTFKEKSCFRLKLHENHVKYKLNGASLHIGSLHANDSGIYHCAVESQGEPVRGSQHVGPGTTLIVRGKRDNYVKRLDTDVLMCRLRWSWTDSFSFTCRSKWNNGEEHSSVAVNGPLVRLQLGTRGTYCKEGK